VPGADYVPEGLLAFAKAAGNFPILFVDCRPAGILRDEGGTAENAEALDNIPVVMCDSLAGELEKIGARKLRIAPAAPYVTVYHYKRDGQILMLMNESAELSFEGTVGLAAQNGFVYYDAFGDRYEEAQCETAAGIVKIRIHLLPGESCLLMEKAGNIDAQCPHTDIGERIANCSKYIDLARDWEVSCTKAGKGAEIGEWKRMEELVPISDADPVFSGTIRYKKELWIEKEPAEAYLAAEQVYEVMRVFVNGKDAGTVLTPPYQVPIGQFLKVGDNTIEIEVATTPARDAASYPQPPFDFFHEALEPTGICGSVGIFLNY
jgi:hypothetical protein